jgi:hypothetical protein
MQCPAASFWLKRALAETANRDPVDSLNDCEVLLEILKAECETACGLASLEQPDAAPRGWGSIEPDSTALENRQAELGLELAQILGLRRDCDHEDRWATGWGTKTNLGLFLTVARFIEQGGI